MSKSAHEQSFYCSQIQRFYCCQILDHVSVSRILGLALLTLRKWPPTLAKMMIVCSVSFFFVKKQRVWYKIEIFVQKIIYMNNPAWIFWQSKIKLASWIYLTV